MADRSGHHFNPSLRGEQGTLRPPAKCKCSEWICNALVDAGVTHVYGGHGGALAPLVNAVVEHPKLMWVVTRNEANASLMAAAHAKLTGGLGVCIATSGPGATNLTTGLYDAQLDQCSVLALTGLKPRAGIGYSEFQDFQQSRMFAAGGLPFSFDVASPEALVPLLRDAVSKALTMRTCVHLGIPVDVQAHECPVPVKKFCAAAARDHITFPEAQEHVLDNVARELKLASQNGSRVVISIGHRCVDAGPQILQLAEQISAPILTRLDAKGCINEVHPLALGVIGVHGKPGLEKATKLIETAQLVLSFGNHDDTLLLCNKAGLQIRAMIQFEPDAACLLANARYNSLYDVVGNISVAVTSLLNKLDALDVGPSDDDFKGHVQQWALDVAESQMDTQMPIPRAESDSSLTQDSADDLWKSIQKRKWTGVNTSKKWDHIGRFEVVANTTHRYCHPAHVLREMSKHIDADDVLCVDTGDVTLWTSLCAVLTKGSRTLSSEKMGTMGYSLCAGIVASLIRKDQGRSIVLAGDGGIQMTINELGTVKQLFSNSSVPYKMLVIVFDNETLGRVAFGFEGSKGCELGPSPDFVQLAKSYGGNGATLTDIRNLPEVINQAFQSTGLFLLHVLVDPTVKADMAVLTDNSIKIMNSG